MHRLTKRSGQLPPRLAFSTRRILCCTGFGHVQLRRLWLTWIVRPMKSALPLTFVAIICWTTLLSSGCQKKTAATNSNPQSQNELHEGTKPLQAADLVGYDGTKLRKSVHQIGEANEKHNQQIEKMVESGPDQ
jgi:hypothetical protein